MFMLCTFQTLKSLGAEDERVQERRRPERRLFPGNSDSYEGFLKQLIYRAQLKGAS